MSGNSAAELAEGLAELGISLAKIGETAQAIDCFRRCLALDPERAEIHNDLGVLLGATGDEAAAGFRRALQIDPDFEPALVNLGGLLLDLGRLVEAEALLTRAIELDPADAIALANLGHLRRAQGQIGEAETLLREALARDGSQARIWNLLGRTLLEGGRAPEAVTCFQRALALAPQDAEAGGNLAYARQFLPGITLSEVAADHRTQAARLAPSSAAPSRIPRHMPRDAGKPRLGFVSGDFRRHPVAYFTVRVLEALATSGEADIYCYAQQAEDDVYTARFRAAAHTWRDVRGFDDDTLAAIVNADGIDVLFDLAGHNDRNRLGLFARRAAPRQIAWAGYMATTGLAAMDAIVADRRVVPPGSEAHYVERVLRMPASYICYDPPAAAPDPGPPPLAQRGAPTFGCLNMLGKLNGPVFDLWAQLLRRVPGSRLLFKNRALECPATGARIAAEFAARGVAAERLELRGGSDQAGHLATFREIDVSLDPFPFTGSTTTLESLWMGVPVLTLPGESFASRHSASFVAALGLADWIAGDADAYLERAAAIDPTQLAALRAELRGRMSASPLCDGEGFARDLMTELAYHGMWPPT